MATATAPWPCPVCAELVPPTSRDCPWCHASADWIDQIEALDFAIRRFHLWKLEGIIAHGQFRQIVDACRSRREAMLQAAQLGHPCPADTGLPPRLQCWSCRQPCPPHAGHCLSCGAPLQAPEVRLLRYQTFLCHEIKRHADAGRLSLEQMDVFLSDTPDRQVELLSRLEQGWVPRFQTFRQEMGKK